MAKRVKASTVSVLEPSGRQVTSKLRWRVRVGFTHGPKIRTPLYHYYQLKGVVWDCDKCHTAGQNVLRERRRTRDYRMYRFHCKHCGHDVAFTNAETLLSNLKSASKASV